MGYYDIAQICRRGHLINSHFREFPQHNQSFCDQCGERTFTKCLNCRVDIRGTYVASDRYADYCQPNFCHACGKPYPWTKLKMEAARELFAELDGLSDADRRILKKSLDELVADSPKAEVASLRFKKVMKKVGAESYEVVKGVVTDVLSETAKKLLFGSTNS